MSGIIHLQQNNEAIRGFLQATPRIYSVCKNLFSNFDINHFAYIKFVENGYMLRLSSDEEWSKKYYGNSFHENLKFYTNHLESKKYISQKINYCLWSQDTYNKNCEIYLELRKYNLGNGFSIYVPRGNAVESFHFASSVKDMHMSNFYINNLATLENFILFFKCEIQDLEKTFTKETLLQIPSSRFSKAESDSDLQSVENHFSLKKYLFELEDDVIYIGKREFQCIYFLAMGKHCKEIAKILNLSPRTVETYINTLKMRAGISSTSVLIKTFIEKNLSKWYSHYHYNPN